MRFIFTNVLVLHTSCLRLRVKKSLTFKDLPEPPLHYETVRASRLLGGASGLSTALDGGYCLYYQQRMSFSKTDFDLYH